MTLALKVLSNGKGWGLWVVSIHRPLIRQHFRRFKKKYLKDPGHAPWFNDAPWVVVYPLKNVFSCLKGRGPSNIFLSRRKCSLIKGLSIDTTHTPPPVPLDSTFKASVKMWFSILEDEKTGHRFAQNHFMYFIPDRVFKLHKMHNRITDNGSVRYDTAVDVLCPLKRGSQTVCRPPWPRCLASTASRNWGMSVYLLHTC